ncbi:unnamed protein product [Cylindrotheca closterium]|uniref:Transmembrane protein n=1 Tax=Cylindrotheca closterium TaxID=2856 RepID=A0AAD2CMI8_9STRA|nr:unnamed protein product [Cylindrotheca closterium]
MFGTKKFLLLLLAVVLMVGSIDAAAVPERKLNSKKEETEATKASSSKSSKKSAAMHPTPPEHPMTEAPKPTDAPMTHPPMPSAAPEHPTTPAHPTAPAHPKGSKKGGDSSGKGSGKGGSGKGGSGKGGSGKGSKKSSNDDGKGKGGKGKGGKGKGSKKSSKKMGGDGDDGGVDPHAPTPAPNGSGSNATASPTSMDSFAVRPAPYALYYTFDNDSVGDATIDQFNELADLTRTFLDEYFTDKYGQTSIIELDDFLTFLTRSDATTRPAMAVYRSVARFNPRSIFYPPRSEIESEIELAFTEPASQLAYLKKLSDDLPTGNPFKTVASIRYGEPADSDSVAASSVSGFATAGIAAAAAGVVVLVAGLALLSRNRNGGDEDASVESFPPKAYKKSSAGSVAGETCAGTTWRSTVNEEELQDEPLDDAPRQHTSKLNAEY